ncbi:MAG: hypothetical protein JWM85_3049 [Acidimicrobiaceae bacterium]|nr:hypothetical protein [Acidimicrobiaceae bacterium]
MLGRRKRRGKPGALAGALLAAGLGGSVLAACSSGAGALGQQACKDVHRSLTLYRAAERAGQTPAADAERLQALTWLRKALRPAALAGSQDGSWQALQTTLSESSRVPESELVTALTAQCAPGEGA